MILHQSDLSAMARCMAEYGYKRAGLPSKTNSRAAYGSVVHHAVQVGERALATGSSRDLATQMALETFLHYWLPSNIESICEPVPPDGWLAGDTFARLREKGVIAIRAYLAMSDFDDIELLGTEFGFMVPIPDTWDEDLGEPHYLAGSVDRLVVRHYKRIPTISCDDFKTGRQQIALRHNQQGTAYALASTLPEFWTGHRGEDGFGEERGTELHERFQEAARRFTWIDLKNFKFVDGGWRGPEDYARFTLAVEQFVALVKSEVYPMSLSGSVCKYCDFRSICGGTGVPEDSHGAPGTF